MMKDLQPAQTTAQTSKETPPRETFGPSWLPYLILAALSASLFAIRICAPPNLLDQDQERPASYVLDAVQNGNWICQRDWTGDITSKPPVWTWISALFTLLSGRITEATLYLPGALAAFGAACLVFAFGLSPTNLEILSQARVSAEKPACQKPPPGD